MTFINRNILVEKMFYSPILQMLSMSLTSGFNLSLRIGPKHCFEISVNLLRYDRGNNVLCV